MTGRLCYLFMCIEQYLVTCYPDRDWTPVAKRCWQWTKGYWNEGWDNYAPVVPEFLFEYDGYEEVNRLSFDGMLSEEDYWELIHLFSGLEVNHAENELNQVLMLPIEFGNECECTDFEQASRSTMAIFFKMQHILARHGISLPDISRVWHMRPDQKNGWGEFTDSEYLSVILK